jgi:hypothetical protein
LPLVDGAVASHGFELAVGVVDTHGLEDEAGVMSEGGDRDRMFESGSRPGREVGVSEGELVDSEDLRVLDMSENVRGGCMQIRFQ